MRILLLVMLAAPDSSWTRSRGVELLALIDPDKDAVHGHWKVAGGILTTPSEPRHQPHRIRLPILPGSEYDLELVAERKGGQPAIVIGLVSGDRQVALDLDGWGEGDRAGLSNIDGKNGYDNEATHRGKLLTDNVPSVVRCQVRRDGIRVVVDGKAVIDWKGDRKRLSVWEGWTMPDAKAPFLACWGSDIRITKLVLTPSTGESTVMPRARPRAADARIDYRCACGAGIQLAVQKPHPSCCNKLMDRQ